MVVAPKVVSGYDALAWALLANGCAGAAREQIAEARVTLAGEH